MSVHLSTATAADTDGLRELIVGIPRDEFGIAIGWDDQPDLHDVDAFDGVGRGGFRVARAGDRVVGTVGLRDWHGFVPIDAADLPPTFPHMAVDTRFCSLAL
jgi:hypothetical protein